MRLRLLILLVLGLYCSDSMAQTGYRTWYRDMDNDGYGTTTDTRYESYPPAGYVANSGDCNDNDNSIKPGAVEVCDGKDNNCDGSVDNNVNIPSPPTPSVDNNCTNSILTRTANGAGVTYYWQSSATGTSIANSAMSITLYSGSVYYLRAKSNNGNCWSPATSINYSIVGTPTIATGNDVSVCIGQNATLSATPGGSGSTIRWYNDPDSGNILATGTTYTVNNVNAPQSYWAESYHDDGNGGCSAFARKEIKILVRSNLNAGTIGGGDQFLCSGGDPNILSDTGAPTGGDGNFSYQWEFSDDGITWNNIAGATSKNYDPPSGLENTRWYRRNVTSCTESKTTTPVVVNIYNDLTTQELSPVDNTCYGGNPPELGVGSVASGAGGNFSYQWQQSTDGVNNWLNIDNATNESYTPPSNAINTKWYRRMASSICSESVYTLPIEVVVNPMLQEGEVSGNQTICFNTTPENLSSLSAATGGDGSYIYNWEYKDINSSTWVELNNSNSETFTEVAPLTNSRYYRRKVSSCGQILYTSEIFIEVLPEVSLPSGPSSVNTCQNSTAVINMVPGNNANVVRWYDSEMGGTSFLESNSFEAPATNATYYVSSFNTESTCESETRKAVSVVVDTEITYYLDNDNDGIAISTLTSCNDPGTGYTNEILPLGDCNDNDPAIGQSRIYYEDLDNDGLGDPSSPSSAQCIAPENYVANANDACPNLTDTSNLCGAIGSSPEELNYVYSRTYTQPTSLTIDAHFFTINDTLRQNIIYLDGVGRSIQEIKVAQSPDRKDIVNHITYNDLGLADKQWLPFVDSTSSPGVFRSGDVANILKGYYNNRNSSDFSGMDISMINPYSEKEYDSSPLNRVLKQAAPGKDWKMGNGNEIEFEYLSNTHDPTNVYNANNDNVRLFTVTTSFADNTYFPTLVYDLQEDYYASGQLFKTVTRDENHSGVELYHTTEEFKNKQGQIVLKRIYGNSDIDGDGTIDASELEVRHDTYYVYDDFGNLTYVLPPKVDTSDGVSTTELKELCYQYVYDQRNRLVEKQLPGKEREYIIYNKLDHPILTQDAVQRTKGEWLFTKYDAYGRVAYTGLANSTPNLARVDVQSEVDNYPNSLWTKQSNDSPVSIGGATLYYSNEGYPDNTSSQVTLTEVLTINYYDEYVDIPVGVPSSVAVLGYSTSDTNTANVKGLATVSRIKVLDEEPAKWINSLTYYDVKGRPIYVYTHNNYLETIDISESELDFAGKVLKIRNSHNRNNKIIVTLDNFTYDHAGRLLSQTQCIGDETLDYVCPGGTAVPSDPTYNTLVNSSRTDIATNSITLGEGFHIIASPSLSYTAKIDPDAVTSGGDQELIVLNTYDELGRIQNKKVGGNAHTSNVEISPGLQTIDYKFNVRGWLHSINEGIASNGDLFGFKLNYNTVEYGGTSLFNGNIAETAWATTSINNTSNPVSTHYRYLYDGLNRIMSATDNTGNYSISGMVYDKMGNIMSLTRNGWQNGSDFTNMDVLDYDYDSGNKLTKVSDSGNSAYGFKDGTNTNADYEYDPNGNMKSDSNKGITEITYNHLNLPTKIVVSGSENGSIDYIYDAIGKKIRKILSTGSHTDYAGHYVYENNFLQFFSTTEGYVTPNGLGGYDYVYQYKDHLGNVRLSYMEDPSNPGTPTIIEESNYYPFGLNHKAYNMGGDTALGNDVAQKWKHNGVELEESFGLGLYEMPLRNYDPALGRFTKIDPVTHYDFSSYQAFDNNPIYWADPTGANSELADNFEQSLGADGLTNEQWINLTRPSFDDNRSFDDQRIVARTNQSYLSGLHNEAGVEIGEGTFLYANGEFIESPKRVNIFMRSVDFVSNLLLWAIYIEQNPGTVRANEVIEHKKKKQDVWSRIFFRGAGYEDPVTTKTIHFNDEERATFGYVHSLVLGNDFGESPLLQRARWKSKTGLYGGYGLVFETVPLGSTSGVVTGGSGSHNPLDAFWLLWSNSGNIFQNKLRELYSPGSYDVQKVKELKF